MKNPIDSGARSAPAGKYLIVVTLALLIAAGNIVYWYFTPGGLTSPVKASEGAYTFFTVTPAAPDIYSTGVVRSDRSAKISPPVAGIVRRIVPERFAPVRGGDVLIELDARQGAETLRQEELTLKSARFQLAQARVQLEYLLSVRARYEELFTWGLVAAMTVEESQANVARQEYEVSLAEQRVAASETAIRYLREQTAQTSIKSPVAGIVTDILVTEGQFVAPGGGSDQASTMMVVSDTSDLFAQLLVDEIDVSRIRTGQEIDLQFDALPGQRATGKIRKIAPAPDSSPGKPGVNFEATVAIATPVPRMRIGMTVFAVMRDTRSAPRRIPAAAVQADARESWVWQAERARARKKPVRIGKCADGECELLAGLESGATIIAGPAGRLRDLSEGHPVAPQ